MNRSIVVVLGSVAVFAACSSSTSEPRRTFRTFGTAPAATLPRTTQVTVAVSGPAITVYSGQHPQTVAALVQEFEAETHIPVKLRSAGEGSLANQLLEEGSDTPADIFYAENPPALNVLDEHHLLAMTVASTLAKVPRQYSPVSGNWVGVSARAVALAYNSGKLDGMSLPNTVLDLANPQWKGKLGLAPSEPDFPPLVTTVAKERGTAVALQWLRALKANSKIYNDNEALLAAVNRGEVAAGIVDHYYLYRLRDETGEQGTSGFHSALHYFSPGDAGSLISISGAGQTASSRHADRAQAFLAFLVSAAAQRIIATSESYEYPLGSAVKTAKKMRPFRDFGASPMTIEDLGDGRQALDLLTHVGLL